MKKNKKRIFFIVSLLLLLIFTLFTIVHLINVKSDTGKISDAVKIGDIESIEIDVEYGYPHYAYSYKIDFLNKSILHEVDEYDKNETFYTNFTDTDAEYFIKRANSYDFFQWNESYETPNVEDGLSIGIYTTFKDGAVQKTHCYEAFPPNYDKMVEVFHEAFGFYI
ncbi:MAG: hypothetical protein NC244_13700 [Alistipes senegalensis]|nr:hypothetical protein [Alistipes senegalensis]